MLTKIIKNKNIATETKVKTHIKFCQANGAYDLLNLSK